MNGPQFRATREAMRLTQADLGRRFGVGQSYISQTEASNAEIPPAWALALDAIGLRERRMDPLALLVELGSLTLTAGGSLTAVTALVTHVPGLHALNGRERDLLHAAGPIRAEYVARQILELHGDRANGFDGRSAREMIDLAAAQTDPTFWIATSHMHLLDRLVSDYLRGRRTLADELPEIVAVTSETVVDADDPDALPSVGLHRWTVTVRGYGREAGTDRLTRLTFDRVQSEALVCALVYDGHVLDLAGARAGD